MAASVLLPDGINLYSMTDEDLSPEDAPRLYDEYRKRLAMMGNSDAEQEKIQELSKDIKMPFVYISGYDITSFEYLTIYILLIMLVFMVIISPIFSAEYQTGADSILRCAKYGRVHLAAAKIVTALAVFTVTFLIGMAMFLLITDVTFGIEGLKASVQMLYI